MTTAKRDIEVLHDRELAICADAEKHNSGDFTQQQREELDAINRAIGALGGEKTANGVRLPTKTARTGAGDPLESDGPTGGGEGLISFGSRRSRGGSCSKLFGVSQASNNGFRSVDDLARSITLGDSSRMAALSGQGGGIPSDGGYAVPTQFAFEMLDKSLESEIVRPRCRTEGMTTDTKVITTFDDSSHASGVLFGGLTGQWLAEGNELDYKTAKLKQIRLQAKKLGFLTASSNELLNDSPQFEGEFSKRMTEAIGWNMDRACLVSGTGAGQPRSVLNDPATITVAKESGQAADTIVYANLCKMFARIHPACLGNSVWVVNQTAIPQLLQMTITVGTGGSFIPLMSESNGEFKILTRPVLFTEKLNPLGDLGDIMLVDLSQYVVGLMKNGMRLDKSQHVKFTTDETVWRVILRADGQGTWTSVFTPVNGDSLSWAVTLAARA